MPPLKIDLDDFALALAAGEDLDEAAHYLDTATGEVLYAGEGVEGLPADLRDNPRYRWIEPLASGDLLGIMDSYVNGLDDPAVAAWLQHEPELEPIAGHVVEPLLYGHSTGLSPIAVILAATLAFWVTDSLHHIAPAWVVWPVRRIMDLLRSIPDLVIATLFIVEDRRPMAIVHIAELMQAGYVA